jgi:DNA-binding PucR family transcriptional regulator
VDLLQYDAKRCNGLARSLLAWLDAHGDVPLAAEMLLVHQNTLRYRISRAMTILDVDLADPTVRLEIHLRLRRWAREAGAASAT